MDRRSVNILSEIIASDSYISIYELARIFNVSRSTIYKHLNEIDDWLQSLKLSKIKRLYGKGVCVDKNVKEKVVRSDALLETNLYEYSPNERKAWIYIYIISSRTPTYLKDFQSLFKVSRNTVLQDIKRLKFELKSYDLTLYSEPLNGYMVEGDESILRRRIIHYINYIAPENGWFILLNEERLDNKKINNQQRLPYLIINDYDLSVIKLVLQKYEKKYYLHLAEEEFSNLIVWFYLFLQRMKQQNYVKIDIFEKEIIETSSKIDGVIFVCKLLSKELMISIPENEMYYLARYLISTKVNAGSLVDPKANEVDKLYEVAENMIKDFQLQAAVEFSNKDQVLSNLLLHLKPTYYRLVFGIKIKNELKQTVKENYPEIFLITKNVIHHFEELIHVPVDENEIAYIAMHFGGWLKEEGIKINEKKLIILIVCINGVGTSRLLESQLESLLPNVNILGVTSMRDYEKMYMNVDLVVSTVPIPDKGPPIIVVNPVLTEKNKEELIKNTESSYFLFLKSRKKSIDSTIDIIKKYTVIKDEKNLRRELADNLDLVPSIKEKSKLNLSDLLPFDSIFIKRKASNWQEALKEAAIPLLNKKYINENYIYKMIENINRLGPYIIITERIALPHALPNDGVHKTGMSMLKLIEPVDLMGESINIFIILASYDNEEHLKALTQLTDILSDPKQKEKLISAKGNKEIFQLITKTHES